MNYGAKIIAPGIGKPVSRYINQEKDIRIYYGSNRFKEFHVVTEGSGQK